MILKAKATFSLAEQMKDIYSNKKKKGLYINNIKRMGPVDTVEYMEKIDREKVKPKNMCNTCIQSRSGI